MKKTKQTPHVETTDMKISELRGRRYRIFVDHERDFTSCLEEILETNRHVNLTKQDIIKTLHPNNLGGGTFMEVITPSGVVFTTESFVNPRDNYNKKTGIAICLNKLKELGAFNE